MTSSCSWRKTREPLSPPSMGFLGERAGRSIHQAALWMVIIACVALNGCGSGGYAGDGITGLSSSAITIDAGQSFQITAALVEDALVSWTLASSSCSGATCGALSAMTGTSVTYTAPAGISAQMKLTLTASIKGTTSSSAVSITVNPDPTISGTPPPGTVGIAYSTTLVAAGGTAPLTWSTVGALPDGLTFNAKTGVISGTPTTAGSYNFLAQVLDFSDVPDTVKAAETIAISTPVATLFILGNPPAGTVGVAYSTLLSASGGTAPYSFSVVSGSLPAGLALSASTGVIGGTPTAPGTSAFTGQVEDASGTKASATFSITVNAAGGVTLVLSPLPGGVVGVPYNATIGVSGGTAPYTCLQTGGTLPAGLSLSAACVVSGTPLIAGTATMTVEATDASTPALSTTAPESITVSPTGSLGLSSPPNGTVGAPYSSPIGVTGGSAPYSCVLVSGTLPAGLVLGAGCLITGTPTTAGTSNLTVTATDSSTPIKTITGSVSVTVVPPPLSITISNLPDATVGTPYSATIGVGGGTAPYSCSIVSGTLPAGLMLRAACLVSGTPTVAGPVTLGVMVTDSSTAVETTTGPVGLRVLAGPPTLILTSPPSATVNVPYSKPIGITGGTAPYTCTLTAGVPPMGLSLSASCVISGTPTAPGSATITVKATDTSAPADTTTGPVTVTVLAATATLTLSSPPNATVTVPYTGIIGVAGGTAPYSCAIVSGTLPVGLSLGAACVIIGTPTVAGTSTVVIHATDAATPTADTVTGPVSVTVSPIPTLTLAGSLPNATLGIAYTQNLVATGGIAPYSYSLTGGSLPAGLSLSATGTISGTPTAVGASSFTVTVTDTEPTPQTASLLLVLLVIYPTTANDSELIGPYAFLFQGYDDVLAGVLAYQTATIASLTADGTGVISDGELDANHQSSNPTGNTVSSHQFLGTYTLGADSRGYMTTTILNADGSTGATTTYAIAAKAPVSPATVATQVDMIEFDDNGLQGTRGSGSMLAQQPAAFSAGLEGTYAFGLSGDTPCLPTCTAGIIAGPAASVGQFTTDGTSLLTSGTSDANIATRNFPDALLTGNYGAADGNGRLALTMNTAGTPVGVYPNAYAVYMVNANQAFLMSIDKHSTYVLLAGTAQLQTQATFSNASLSGAIVGYENAQVSPGLLGVALGDVLNLSTATIFRVTSTTPGLCDFSNVDVAGLTGLVNGLTGLGSAIIQNALLGTYQSTGPTVCTVGSNGRGVLNYPNPDPALQSLLLLLGLSTGPPAPREFYLVSPDSGYFLETGYAGLGRFEPQTGTPFTLASLNGTYVYASLPAASLASINTSGIFVADGAGNATTTTDLNIGVGNVNVLQVDVTSSSAYHLADATAGRFVLGTTIVLYEIAPGRFVLVDTNVLTTSPSISLLY